MLTTVDVDADVVRQFDVEIILSKYRYGLYPVVAIENVVCEFAVALNVVALAYANGLLTLPDNSGVVRALDPTPY